MSLRPELKSKRASLGKGITSLLGGFDSEPSAALNSDATTEKSVSDTRIGAAAAHDNSSSLNVIEISQESIQVNPHQPRRIFNEQELKELAESIKVDGIIQPLTVTKTSLPGKYMLIAGERRLRASKLAGLTKVPAIVREAMTDIEQLRVALIENIQRQDLNVLEEAEAYHSLINDFGLTQEQCAEKVGKERSTVANFLRILNLPKEIRDDLAEARLTMGHGRALLSLEDKKTMLRARDIIIKKSMNVRQTERLVKDFRAHQANPAHKLPKNAADLEYLAQNLRTTLKTKVKISGNGTKGKIEITYFSSADLERLIETLGQKI